MKLLSASEVENLAKAAEHSMFPAFWGALITACRTTGLSPLRLLGPYRPGRLPEAARRDVEALRAAGCPFDLSTSKWGWESLLGGFRALAGRAGIAGAETIEFEAIYG